jgi:Flp pilus assembly protein TadD
MRPRAPQVPQALSPVWRKLAIVSLVALSTAACLKRGGSADITGSIPNPQQGTPEIWRRHAEIWGPKFEANPTDATAALNYARALRVLDQKPQAAAVLQQAAIRNPNNPEILAAYGKVLGDLGRYKEAAEALNRAHSPDKPDWRILSAQGAIADQTGDHALAQQYYDSALKLVPGEPSVLANLGLSQALSKRLEEAERTLRQAADHPKADGRVRQNLALVLGLRGKFADAETVLRQDLSVEEAGATLAELRGLAAQPKGMKSVTTPAPPSGKPAGRA